MELFDDNEMIEQKKAVTITLLYLFLAEWSKVLAAKVTNMVTELTDDPNAYDDVTQAVMHRIMLNGEKYESVIMPAMRRLEPMMSLIITSREQMDKDDFYEFAFRVNEAKSYIVEMDKASHKIGIGMNMSAIGGDVQEFIETIMASL